MAVRRKNSGIFNATGYGSAPLPTNPRRAMQAQAAGGQGQGGGDSQIAPPPQQPQQMGTGEPAPMSPMNVDPFLTPGGPMENQVDPLTILSLMAQRGLL